MRFVAANTGQQMYPQASPSGHEGELFDTGWDVHYPGPARIFLSETDIRDILSEDDVLERPLIVELLEARGWLSPDEYKATVAETLAALEEARAETAEAIAEADGLKLALARQTFELAGSNTGSFAS